MKTGCAVREGAPLFIGDGGKETHLQEWWGGIRAAKGAFREGTRREADGRNAPDGTWGRRGESSG